MADRGEPARRAAAIVSARAWDGAALLEALQEAAANLREHADEVNRLNVFPVPDGDTGSNMLATLEAALSEAHAGGLDRRTLADVAAALCHGALMGARGNSGVILSQLLRGVSDSLNGTDELDGRGLACALDRGHEAAHAAVARPVEGTILSVARDAARAASDAAASSPADGAALEHVLAAAVDEARAAVARTPSQLAVLREAGVVDAGGRGLELILAGALGYARGSKPTGRDRPGEPLAGSHDRSVVPATVPAGHAGEGDTYGYETVFVVTPWPGRQLDLLAVRTRLEQIGESVLVAGDARAVKVHVHNERPDEVIAYGLSLGRLSNIVVENLDRQAGAALRRRGERRPGVVAVVAVAPGEGLARVFETLGARVVHGELGNPSAGELASAIDVAGARHVIVLPNNPNVRLAAEQAVELCAGQEVRVVATRNAAEGVASLLAFDERADLERNADVMAGAAATARTLQVTAAVRDAGIGGKRVRRGEHIVIDPDGNLLAADTDRQRAVVDALRTLAPGFELLTLYQGEEVDRSEAERLGHVLQAEFEAVEVEVVDGGQRHYSFLISVE